MIYVDFKTDLIKLTRTETFVKEKLILSTFHSEDTSKMRKRVKALVQVSELVDSFNSEIFNEVCLLANYKLTALIYGQNEMGLKEFTEYFDFMMSLKCVSSEAEGTLYGIALLLNHYDINIQEA